MLIGVPKEIKNHEYRVGLTPGSVRELVHHGHQVLVESEAGAAIDMHDAEYRAVGAEIVGAAAIYARADMVVKVKEPQPAECAMLRPGQLLFTYLHLAPDPAQAQALMASGATAIAYETVTDAAGGLPLLAPMSEVAGRMAVQVGAKYLEKEMGGAGIWSVRRMHRRRADAVKPRSAILGSWRGEGRTRDLLGVKSEGDVLWAVLADR